MPLRHAVTNLCTTTGAAECLERAAQEEGGRPVEEEDAMREPWQREYAAGASMALSLWEVVRATSSNTAMLALR